MLSALMKTVQLCCAVHIPSSECDGGGLKSCYSYEGVIEGVAVCVGWVGPAFDGHILLDGVSFRHIPKLRQGLATLDFHSHVLGDTVVPQHASGN